MEYHTNHAEYSREYQIKKTVGEVAEWPNTVRLC